MSYFKLDRRGLKEKDNNACGVPVLRWGGLTNDKPRKILYRNA